MSSIISSDAFYGEYYGHKVTHLKVLLPKLRESSDSVIWTAGDSTLDNKYWFRDQENAVGAYSDILRPPVSTCDVTYWLNFLDNQNQRGRAAINTAVEASTLNTRSYWLLAQDQFIRDNIAADDILIVSVGGNDIALHPLPCTVASIACFVYCVPTWCIEHRFSCGTVPVDDTCCGCGPSLLSCLCSFPPCLGYFHHLFGTRVQKYIERLTSKTKPKKVLVCTIYFLDEVPAPSWASLALWALGYDKNPSKVQTLIRNIYTNATSAIQIAGTEVIHVPLFHVLDGKTSADYAARVEPSALGGRKLAQFLLRTIDQQSPSAVSMADRE